MPTRRTASIAGTSLATSSPKLQSSCARPLTQIVRAFQLQKSASISAARCQHGFDLRTYGGLLSWCCPRPRGMPGSARGKVANVPRARACHHIWRSSPNRFPSFEANADYGKQLVLSRRQRESLAPRGQGLRPAFLPPPSGPTTHSPLYRDLTTNLPDIPVFSDLSQHIQEAIRRDAIKRHSYTTNWRGVRAIRLFQIDAWADNMSKAGDRNTATPFKQPPVFL